MKIREQVTGKDSEEEFRGSKVIVRQREKKRIMKREHIVKSSLCLRGLSNFLSILLLRCDFVSPGRPLNIRISAMGSAKTAGWAPDGPFSAFPWAARLFHLGPPQLMERVVCAVRALGRISRL